MKKADVLLLPVLAMISCHSSGNKSTQNQSGSSVNQQTVTAPHAYNSVSTQDKSDDWQLLFDGKDLSGWRGYQNNSTAAWNVDDGTLHCNGHKKNAAHTDLITDKEYKNFVLSIKWKISPASNSGIMFHVSEKYPHTSTSGPEYQIIDDKGWPGKLEKWQHTGCNYAMQVPDTASTNPVGEWNTTKIVVNGAHVEHWLNGMKILEYELWSPEWKKQKANGKWKNDGAYGMSKTGHIALQYHGGDVWFKDIKLKEL